MNTSEMGELIAKLHDETAKLGQYRRYADLLFSSVDLLSIFI